MNRRKRLRVIILFATLCVVAAAVTTQRYWRSISSRPIAVYGGESMSALIDVEPYLQTDVRWGGERLGPSEGLISGYGCALCCAAMALSANGNRIDPKEMNRRLIEVGGFTNSGLLIWKALEEISGSEFQVVVDDHPSHAVVDRELKRGNPIIAKVLYDGRIFHWVLITGKLEKNYLMHDPLGSGTPHESMGEYPEGIFTIRYLKSRRSENF